jgi:hypothetical protein
MKIQHVDTNYVNQLWPKVETYLSTALEYQSDYTLEHVKLYLTSGQWMLIVAIADDGFIQGATAVQFFNRPNDRVAFVVGMGGRLISNQNTYSQFSDLLKAFGATCIEGAARESVARLWTRYGLSEKYRIVGAKL